MDFMDIYAQVARFFLQICSVSFVIGGVTVTVGAVFLFSALASVLIWVIRLFVS